VSESLRKSDVAVRLPETNGDADADHDDAKPMAVGPRRLEAVAPPPTLGTVTTLPTEFRDQTLPTDFRDQELAARDVYFSVLELRLRELVEIEKMRALEIRSLESEGEKQAAKIYALEVALFHSERRANELDRRWNSLAQVYDAAAAALVSAGGQLETIHQQASYKILMSCSRVIRRVPILNGLIHRLIAPFRGRSRAAQAS
jgi:hypothetical protein